jgi:aminopeptidase N
MWIHESFTNYSESLFVEYYYGKEAGYTYVKGIRKNIKMINLLLVTITLTMKDQ